MIQSKLNSLRRLHTAGFYLQRVCVSTVHYRVNKMISNAATEEAYNNMYRCLTAQYKYEKNRSGTASNPVPCEITLNQHNIHRAQRTILEVYQARPDSLHSKLKRSPFWSIMHDGISKFEKEFNGQALKGTDPFTLEPIYVPYYW